MGWFHNEIETENRNEEKEAALEVGIIIKRLILVGFI